MNQFLVSVMVIFVGLSSFAREKDLTHRLGVGLKDNTSISVPSLGAIYYFNQDLAFTSGIGVDTMKDNSKFQANIGLRRSVFKEENMIFFLAGQVGMITNEVATVKDTGFDMNATFGGEFFFTGLESLGFSFEAGIGVSSLKNVRFRTVANDPFKAGIVFYF